MQHSIIQNVEVKVSECDEEESSKKRIAAFLKQAKQMKKKRVTSSSDEGTAAAPSMLSPTAVQRTATQRPRFTGLRSGPLQRFGSPVGSSTSSYSSHDEMPLLSPPFRSAAAVSSHQSPRATPPTLQIQQERVKHRPKQAFSKQKQLKFHNLSTAFTPKGPTISKPKAFAVSSRSAGSLVDIAVSSRSAGSLVDIRPTKLATVAPPNIAKHFHSLMSISGELQAPIKVQLPPGTQLPLTKQVKVMGPAEAVRSGWFPGGGGGDVMSSSWDSSTASDESDSDDDYVDSPPPSPRFSAQLQRSAKQMKEEFRSLKKRRLEKRAKRYGPEVLKQGDSLSEADEKTLEILAKYRLQHGDGSVQQQEPGVSSQPAALPVSGAATSATVIGGLDCAPLRDIAEQTSNTCDVTEETIPQQAARDSQLSSTSDVTAGTITQVDGAGDETASDEDDSAGVVSSGGAASSTIADDAPPVLTAFDAPPTLSSFDAPPTLTSVNISPVADACINGTPFGSADGLPATGTESDSRYSNCLSSNDFWKLYFGILFISR